MTIHTEKNYLEETYLTEEYLQTFVHAKDGVQFEVTIDKRTALAAQFQSSIVDDLKANGVQVLTNINDKTSYLGIQFLSSIENKLQKNGIQFEITILNKLNDVGLQNQTEILDTTAFGTQVKVEINDFVDVNGLQFSASIIDKVQSLAEQFSGEINKQFPNGLQFLINIVDDTISLGTQITVNIIDKESILGKQFTSVIENTVPNGVQFLSSIVDKTSASGIQFNADIHECTPLGIQFSSDIIDYKSPLGLQVWKNTLFHQWAGYLIDEYLVGSYLVKAFNVYLPIQFQTNIIDYKKNLGTQFEVHVEHEVPYGLQFLGVMEKKSSYGVQFNTIMQKQGFLGIQFQGVMQKQGFLGIQFISSIVDATKKNGVQFDSISVRQLGTQFRVVLYNTTNLRILYEFPSRGISPSNWVASSTATGDFNISNVNDDIVEHVWRSATGAITSVTLVCDAGLPQGIYLDTLAFLNHNLTTSANVTLLGSNDPLFNIVGVTINFTMTLRNFIYISPDLPLAGYRYWKFIISDSSNVDNFLQIGTIIFGSSTCFQGECFKNPIIFKRTHFVDAIETEGFTTAQNDRGIKSRVGMDFQSLNFSGGNYTNLQEIFEYVRTNLKALWIPTPQYPLRYGVFGKLVELPQESHTDNGENADYVDLSVEIDEAK